MSLAPKRWAEFQHYKDRSPAWIKLHRKLLDDYEYNRLPLASRALAPMLWLLAAEYDDGKITATIEEIAFRLRVTEQDLLAGLKPLIESGFFLDASNTLAGRYHDAIPEKEEETQVRDREDSRAVAKATRPSTDQKFEDFKKAYPKRQGANPSKPARRAWDAAIRSGSSPDQIIAAVKAGVGFDPKKIGTEYIPRMSTWLSERRFEDHTPQADNVVPIGFYAAPDSEELELWDAYSRQKKGSNLPRDKNGGWYVSSRYPPGYEPQAATA